MLVYAPRSRRRLTSVAVRILIVTGFRVSTVEFGIPRILIVQTVDVQRCTIHSEKAAIHDDRRGGSFDAEVAESADGRSDASMVPVGCAGCSMVEEEPGLSEEEILDRVEERIAEPFGSNEKQSVM